ncbi:hypothetical protein ATANTOWER_001283 [Ataeniobius toweri]|uniref:Uncharacterized protein n=1 Tax=Ataeniobius toweri TaxID=208326 RepID=A0ABU7BTK9_9TELE|nr:hypothetical protein [Ataeniobius toweri]
MFAWLLHSFPQYSPFLAFSHFYLISSPSVLFDLMLLFYLHPSILPIPFSSPCQMVSLLLGWLRNQRYNFLLFSCMSLFLSLSVSLQSNFSVFMLLGFQC